MFDITSWIRETIFRRPKLGKPVAGEELSEKKTTKMGYFLLVCMFGAIISTATWSLSIIRDIPELPKYPNACFSNILWHFGIDPNRDDEVYYNMTHDFSYQDNCDLIGKNPVYDITNAYNALKPGDDILVSLQSTYETKKYELSNLVSMIDEQKRAYKIALTEKIAGESNLNASTEQLRQTLQDNQAQLTRLETEIDNLNKKIIETQKEYIPQVKVFRDIYDQLVDDYNQAYLWYRSQIALLSLIFSGLIFTVFYKFYVRFKTRNSPQTIIFSVATFAYGLVLLWVLLEFLWDMIPHTFLEMLLGWISVFTPLLFLVQFFWPVFVVAIFGLLVYRIQKRLYAPENILKRFISDEKCPNCGNSVDITKPYCPLCAHEIQIHCPYCKALTLKGMPHCSSCGKDI